MWIIVGIVVYLASMFIAYIWGQEEGYNRGRSEVIKEMQSVHNMNGYKVISNVDVIHGGRARSNAASKQRSLHKRRR